MKIMRFDDVCANTDMNAVRGMTKLCEERGFKVWWGVSPLCSSHCPGGRVFAPILQAQSSLTAIYRVLDKSPAATWLVVPDSVTVCSHGLVHVDHRLLDRQAQELSIVVSCAMIHTDVFVPPYNKWDRTTEDVCARNRISLVKWESGWLGVEYNELRDQPNVYKWYLHPCNWTVDSLNGWLDDAKV